MTPALTGLGYQYWVLDALLLLPLLGALLVLLGRRSRQSIYDLMRRAWPFRTLERAEFDAVVDMLAKGFKTGRGRSGAYLHHDAVNDRLRGRRNARHAAIVSGGNVDPGLLADVLRGGGGSP